MTNGDSSATHYSARISDVGPNAQTEGCGCRPGGARARSGQAIDTAILTMEKPLGGETSMRRRRRAGLRGAGRLWPAGGGFTAGDLLRRQAQPASRVNSAAALANRQRHEMGAGGHRIPWAGACRTTFAASGGVLGRLPAARLLFRFRRSFNSTRQPVRWKASCRVGVSSPACSGSVRLPG